MTTVTDKLGRPLSDLRVSVTDRCNFRCRYCMPREHFDGSHRYLGRAEILGFDEILSVVKSMLPLGLRKVRLTGGEPLLRGELPRLVRSLRELPGLELALTTNGCLLAKHAAALREAGLDRVTVSLDSMDPEVFARMTDSGSSVEQVLSGIDAARSVGFSPIKINVVARRGVNDESIIELARHFHGSSDIVRFIEYMDVGSTNGWRPEQVLSGDEIIERIHHELPLVPLPPSYPGEVARRYRYRDGEGEIGVISSVSKPFCGDCTRLRLSADGRIFGCLFARVGTDLRAILRSNSSAESREEAVRVAVRDFWQARTDRYSELERAPGRRLPRVEMSYLGG